MYSEYHVVIAFRDPVPIDYNRYYKYSCAGP